MAKYASYHTNTFIKFRLGLLPKNVIDQIPRSTLKSWKKRDHLAIRFLHEELNESELEVHRLVHKYKHLTQLIALLSRTLKTYRQLAPNRTDLTSQSCWVQLINSMRPKIGLKSALKLTRISKGQYYNWSRETCSRSPIKRCFNTHVRQLAIREIDVIKKYMTDPRFINWPSSSVFHQMRRDKAAMMALSTFYKYVRLLHLSRKTKRFRKSDHYQKITSSKPLSVLHMDTTIQRFGCGRRLCISVITDNYSKAILGLRFAKTAKSDLAADNLAQVINEYFPSQTTFTLITDNGSENHGKVRSLMLKLPAARQVIAQVDIVASNSVVEATNKVIKHQFLLPHSPTYEQALIMLPKIKEKFNNQPRNMLNGLTPGEVLSGQQPAKVDVSKDLKLASIRRMAENRTLNCSRDDH